jgi:ribosomal protein S12 methylthiotransferase
VSGIETKQHPVRVGLISLGCAKNLVDSEVMLGSLAREGMEITNEASLADVVIVNTCSFIDSAQEESVDSVLASAQARDSQNPRQALVVAGCLPQRFQKELPGLLPEVDAFMGLDQVPQVAQIVREALAHRAACLAAPPERKPRSKKLIQQHLEELDKSRPDAGERPLRTAAAPAKLHSAVLPSPINLVSPRSVYVPDYATPRFRLTPRHLAYIKIAEGCNHPCSFCIIPRIRGSHRSRPQADIVAEARQLIASGVRELNLISQDTTYYGLDLRPSREGSIAAPDKFTAANLSLPAGASTLPSLLRELNAIEGDFWIRLLYTHPAHWTSELIQTIAACEKVARYVDMPLQHIHPVMLERMRRETSRQYILDLIDKIRAGIPGIALRTTFIVGFPGETAEAFEMLLDFIRSTRFERLGVFAYSQEEGTRAAKMEDQIPVALKKQRHQQAMAAQLQVARQVSESFVNRTIRVLVEDEATASELRQARVQSWEHGLVRGRDRHNNQLQGRYLVARGDADAPDIDGRVYVRGQLPLGEFARVKIIGHTDYDLIAEPA